MARIEDRSLKDAGLVSLDWALLSSGLARLSAGVSADGVLRAAVAAARPLPVAEDRSALEALEDTGAPLELRLRRGLRVDPERYLDDAIALAAQDDGPAVEDMLLELARAERLENLLNPDVFLAYFSERHRLAISGVTGRPPSDLSSYDGEPVLAEALGWRQPFPGRERPVYSADEVARIAADLDAFDASPYPRGNMRPLLDFVEAAIDPEFRSRRLTLGDAVNLDLDRLRAHYRDAAAKGRGMLSEAPE